MPNTNWPDAMVKYLSAPDDDGLVRFDYKALTQSPEDLEILDNYIVFLEDMDPDLMCVESTLGFWSNLYNALTVRVIAENYPVKSIKKIGGSMFSKGPWKQKITTVDYRELSLDDIEHKRLRATYRNPLIHYMLNCASVGCPNLKAGEWKRATLKEDAKAAARDYINSPRGVRVTDKGLVVSKIYKWFDEDFGGTEAKVLEHIREYADEDLAALIDDGAIIAGYDYDWSLNGFERE